MKKVWVCLRLFPRLLPSPAIAQSSCLLLPCCFFIGFLVTSIFLRLLPHSLSDEISVPNPLSTISTALLNESRRFAQTNDSLFSSVTILCWILTNPTNHKTKAAQVKKTWGKRCNKLLFISSVQDDDLPSVALPVQEGREHLWAKTKQAFRYIYDHHLQDADWFFKADDDTYAVMENLRLFLSGFDPGERLLVGCHFKPYSPQGYMSGGAGYVVTRKTVATFVQKVLASNSSCRRDDGGFEDVEIGKCLSNAGVRFVDGRDDEQSLLFHPYMPHVFVMPGRLNQSDTVWFLEYLKLPVKKGFKCCSRHAITFHYVQPKMMKTVHHLIYRLRPYGLDHSIEIL